MVGVFAVGFGAATVDLMRSGLEIYLDGLDRANESARLDRIQQEKDRKTMNVLTGAIVFFGLVTAGATVVAAIATYHAAYHPQTMPMLNEVVRANGRSAGMPQAEESAESAGSLETRQAPQPPDPRRSSERLCLPIPSPPRIRGQVREMVGIALVCWTDDLCEVVGETTFDDEGHDTGMASPKSYCFVKQSDGGENEKVSEPSQACVAEPNPFHASVYGREARRDFLTGGVAARKLGGGCLAILDRSLFRIPITRAPAGHIRTSSFTYGGSSYLNSTRTTRVYRRPRLMLPVRPWTF